MVGENDIPLEAGQSDTLRSPRPPSRNVTIRRTGARQPAHTTSTTSRRRGPARQVVRVHRHVVGRTIHGQVGIQGGGGRGVHTLLETCPWTGGAIPPAAEGTRYACTREQLPTLPRVTRGAIVDASHPPVPCRLLNAAGPFRGQRLHWRSKATTRVGRDTSHIAAYHGPQSRPATRWPSGQISGTLDECAAL